MSKSNPDDTPILTVGVSGPFARQLLSDVARYQVQEKLQTVAGVGQITLNGYLDRNVRIWLDTEPARPRSGVVATDIIGAIQSEHVEVPGGTLDTGAAPAQRAPARRGARPRHAPQARRAQASNDAPVYLEDVALVEDGFEDVTSMARLDGAPLQALGVLKQRGTNAVAVANGDARQGRRDPDAACPRA